MKAHTEGWTTAYDDLIREGTRGVNAIRMLRKGGWRVYSKVRRTFPGGMLPPRLDHELVLAVGRQVEWRGRGLAQLVSLYAERLAYFRRLCATEAEVATAVFRERVRSFLSGLWRQSRACKHALRLVGLRARLANRILGLTGLATLGCRSVALDCPGVGDADAAAVRPLPRV